MTLPLYEVRAVQTRSLLRAISILTAEQSQTIRERMPPSRLLEIERALPMQWLSMHTHMRLCTEIFDAVGPDRFVDVFEQTMTQTWEQPLLKGFVGLGSNLFGLSPLAVVKRTDFVYHHLSRGLGTMRAVGSEREATVDLRDFPSQHFRFEVWVHGLHGCVRSLLQLTKHRGTCAVTETDPERGFARFQLRW
jgi:hypothetical protein